MKFVYQPEGADPRKWDYAPDKLMNVEAEAIERVTKMDFADFVQAVGRGNMTALHALLWVMLKRQDPTLAYKAVEFSLSDVTFDLDDEEARDAIAGLEARVAEGEELEPAELAALEALRADVAKIADESTDAEVDAPKV